MVQPIGQGLRLRLLLVQGVHILRQQQRRCIGWQLLGRCEQQRRYENLGAELAVRSRSHREHQGHVGNWLPRSR